MSIGKKKRPFLMRAIVKSFCGIFILFLCDGKAISNETWHCRYEIADGKIWQDDYLVAEDRMIPKKGKIAMKIIENNSDHIIAYNLNWSDKKPPLPYFQYFLIEKHSGRFTIWDDVAIVSMQNQFGTFDVSTLAGTCALNH